MKKLALNLLAWLAKLVAEKYRVKIVAVTGSVGKTTAKEAIYTVLSQTYDVGRSLYNANTEWGIVASVIQPGFEPTFTAEGKAKVTLGQLFGLVWQAKLKLLFKQPYPTILVLELAADRPGDIQWFNRWFRYDVVVVTVIGSTHVDYFKDQAELTAEKLALIEGVKPSGLVVLNGECERCRGVELSGARRKLVFGWANGNDYWAELVSENQYRLHHGVTAIEVKLPVGRQFGPAALIAMAVGEEFGMTPELIQVGLEKMQPVAGRFQILKGQRWTVIDDTYNAAPESMAVALTSLNDVARGRRVAILGEMRELGSEKEAKHHQLGQRAAELTDVLVAMGEAGEMIAKGAREAGMLSQNIVKLRWDPHHPKVDETISQLLPILQDGDTVLVKASRTIYLDRLASKLLI